jgi:hypothetical protein
LLSKNLLLSINNLLWLGKKRLLLSRKEFWPSNKDLLLSKNLLLPSHNLLWLGHKRLLFSRKELLLSYQGVRLLVLSNRGGFIAELPCQQKEKHESKEIESIVIGLSLAVVHLLR